MKISDISISCPRCGRGETFQVHVVEAKIQGKQLSARLELMPATHDCDPQDNTDSSVIRTNGDDVITAG